ncbi:MAG: type II restriction endonuclease, partial [Chloroflexota bacterium]|nr:type II restriction endonuclease [Chloroflexota bacterium]
MWDKESFRRAFIVYFDKFTQTVATDAGDWVIKGFIDVYQNVYTISVDTKVISKLVELMLIPIISQFAKRYDYEVVLAKYQNYYPDITLIAPDDTLIAIDLKSTYRASSKSVSGFTLGAFTGYFRDRSSTKNIMFPYGEYAAHFVLGIIYTRTEAEIEEQITYTL